MAWVYILQGASGRHYIGSTPDLQARFAQHLRGHTATTKRLGGEVQIVAQREVTTLAEARQLERFLKAKKNPRLAIYHLNNAPEEQPRKPSGLVGSSTLPPGTTFLPMNGLFLEDVQPGDRFPSEVYEVTEQAMVQFAREFDPQPFHLDRAAAERSVFNGLAASGWQTAAIAMRLMMTGPMQFVGGAIGLGVDELRWPVAVRPGDALRVVTEIIEVRPSQSKPRHGIIRLRNVMVNQRGEVVLSYFASALVERKPDPADAE